MKTTTVVLGLTAWLLSCATPPTPYLTLVREPLGHAVRLRLLPAPGTRINARLKPALETPEGTVVRFDSPHLTPDSSYFTAPPEALASAPAVGVIHASVCPMGEAVCRVVEVRSEK